MCVCVFVCVCVHLAVLRDGNLGRALNGLALAGAGRAGLADGFAVAGLEGINN